MAAAELVLAAAIGATIGFAVATARSRQRRHAEQATDPAIADLRARHQETGDDLALRARVLDALEDAVVLWGADGRRIFSNRAAEALETPPPSALSALVPSEIRDVVSSVATTGATASIEVEAGPTRRWLRATATPTGADGSVLLVVRDVTEARRLDAVRRDFVANASHELKTPIASIRAAAETLRNGAIEDPPAAARFTEQLERDAVRLARIVSDLLDLSRLETGSELVESVRLDGLVLDEVERLQDRADEAGVTVKASVERVPVLRGAARDVALMVRNLIDNAVRYTPRGGSVDLVVTKDGGDVVLRVSDTGIGVPRRDLTRIFERFYRVDRARSRDTGGTGLGLAIVKHVAENHGGSVRVASELGRGTTFEVRLPAA